MCIIHNSVGCLTTIRSRLDASHINEFRSLNELIDFLNNYGALVEEVIARHSTLIEDEKAELDLIVQGIEEFVFNARNEILSLKANRLSDLYNRIDALPATNSRIVPTFIDYWKNFIIWTHIWSCQVRFHYRLKALGQSLKNHGQTEKARLNYLSLNYDDAVAKSCSSELGLLQLKRSVIEDIRSTIYGAFGEYEVVKALGSLSDEHILINDFNYQFSPALYNRNEDYYIKSVQIDHLVVSRAGVFIIETKNWSERSIDNAQFYSPITQVRRANYALYMILADSNLSLIDRLFGHHWGSRKIPLRNLLVLINHKPREQFQFVKILAPSELTSYINYFPPIFTNEETHSIADFLLKCSVNNSNSLQVDIY